MRFGGLEPAHESAARTANDSASTRANRLRVRVVAGPKSRCRSIRRFTRQGAPECTRAPPAHNDPVTTFAGRSAYLRGTWPAGLHSETEDCVMAETATVAIGQPGWADLGSSDPTAAHAFYTGALRMDGRRVPRRRRLRDVHARRQGGRRVRAALNERGSPSAWTMYVLIEDAAASRGEGEGRRRHRDRRAAST